MKNSNDTIGNRTRDLPEVSTSCKPQGLSRPVTGLHTDSKREKAETVEYHIRHIYNTIVCNKTHIAMSHTLIDI